MLNKFLNLDRQYRQPTGLLGRYIGRQMARDHLPENEWTVELLQPRPDDHILEIGFGPGVAIEQLTHHVPQGRIVGVDFSRAMVAAAGRRNAQVIKRGQVALHWADVTQLPLGDASFDKAYSIHSIYFWPQPEKALREIKRVLKVGGLLVLTVLPKEKWQAASPATPVGTPECIPYTGDELVHLLLSAGFSPTRIEVDTQAECPSNYSVIGLK